MTDRIRGRSMESWHNGYEIYGISCTVSPGPRPTSVPSGVLIQPFYHMQQTWAENRGLCPFGAVGSLSNTMWRGPEAYLPIKWHLDPSGRLATEDMDRKLGWVVCGPFWGGELGPYLTPWSGQDRGLRPYQVVCWSIQPFATIGAWAEK